MTETPGARAHRSRLKHGSMYRLDVVRAISDITSGATNSTFFGHSVQRACSSELPEYFVRKELNKMIELGELTKVSDEPGVARQYRITAEFLRTYARDLSDSDSQRVFISYVKEDWPIVEPLVNALVREGFGVWVDRNDLGAGQNWQSAIQEAIQDGAAFIGCFSTNYVSRESTYMNEELTLAADQLRMRPEDDLWFFPVRLDNCVIPRRSLGGGRHVSDIQYTDLFPDFALGVSKLIRGLIRQEQSRRGNS